MLVEARRDATKANVLTALTLLYVCARQTNRIGRGTAIGLAGSNESFEYTTERSSYPIGHLCDCHGQNTPLPWTGSDQELSDWATATDPGPYLLGSFFMPISQSLLGIDIGSRGTDKPFQALIPVSVLLAIAI